MFDMFNNDESTSDESSYSSESNYSSDSRGDIFVISIGGSLLVKAKPDTELLRQLSQKISSFHASGKKIVLVIGGGKIARNYVECLDSFEVNNFQKDLMGIAITRANALMVANVIPECHKEVLSEVNQAKVILDAGKIPVFGGLMPFFTTDAVAALIAEALNATFVNLTNVDGIYAADPRDYPDARRFDEINYSDLISLIISCGSKPGQNVVLDFACCMILQRSNLLGVVLDGSDVENFSNYLEGNSFTGTVIKDTAVSIDDAEIEEVMDKPKRKRKTLKKKSSKKRKSSSKEFDESDVDNLEL